MGTGNETLLGTIQNLTDSQLISQVGPAAFAMGSSSYKNGEVVEVDLTSHADKFKARVKAGPLTYTCWIESSQATVTRVELTCACRVATRCRHALAALLWVRAQAPQAKPRWKEVLAPLQRPMSAGEPLALCIECGGEGILTPLRGGSEGQWTSYRASWRDLTNRQWDSVTEDLDPGHLAALRALYQQSTGAVNAAPAARWQPSYDRGGNAPSTRVGSAKAKAGQVSIAKLGSMAFTAFEQLQQQAVALLVAEETRGSATTGNNASGYRRVHLAGAPARLRLIDTNYACDSISLRWVVEYRDIQTGLEQLVCESVPIFLLGDELVPLSSQDLQAWSVARAFPTLEVPSAEVVELHQLAAGPLAHLLQIRDPEPDTLIAVPQWQGECGRVCWQVDISESGVLHREDFSPQKHARVPHSKLWRLMRAVSEVVDYRLQPLAKTNYLDAAELLPLIHDAMAATKGLPVVWEAASLPNVDSIARAQVGLEVRELAEEEGKTDWFEVETIVQAQGQRLKLGKVVAALAGGRDLIRSEEGNWVRLNAADFAHLRELLDSLSDADVEEGAARRVSRSRLAAMAGAEALGWDTTWVGKSIEFAKQLEHLRTVEETHSSRAAPLNAHLRPYQEAAVTWLLQLRKLGFGGILADDMGLGKTMQLLSFIATVQQQERRHPVLVCAPTSVVAVWEREAKRFFPQLRVEVVRATAGKTKLDLEQWRDRCDVVVTSWALLRLDRETYQQVEWEGVVLDEAQMVKNPQTQTHAAVRNLKRAWTVAVTGTPIENSIADLWSILALTNPGLLPSRKRFLRRYGGALASATSEDTVAQLFTLISPFIRRRTKEQVAGELPAKTEQTIGVDLDASHQQVYERALTAVQRQLVGADKGDSDQWGFLLAALTKLRLLALDPTLGDEDGSCDGQGSEPVKLVKTYRDSAKTRYLIEQLEQLRDSGHRALVFSQFTSYLRLVARALERAQLSYCYLDGSTRGREEVIERFRSGEETAFLLSLKAGGTGLTLTEADYVFLMDPWWNPAVEQQAVDRTHRIGQRQPVNVYRLYGNGTIEEKVLDLQAQKRQLVERVFAGSSSKLSYQELSALLRSK